MPTKDLAAKVLGSEGTSRLLARKVNTFEGKLGNL